MALILETERALSEATAWLLHSGIQNLKPRSPHHGGFHAWYEMEEDCYPFIYAEITGYVTTLLLFLHLWTNSKIYLERAKKAGEWILNKLKNRPAIPCLFPVTKTLYNLKKNWAYAFDNGILINTLVNLYRTTGHKKYLTAAKKIADWMIENLQRNDGGFFFAYNTVTREKLIDAEDFSWSTTGGSFQGKIALGLLNLFKETREARYKISARRLLAHCLFFQRDGGPFLSYPTHQGTHLHPHTYTLEALLVCGHILKDPVLIQKALQGLRWNFGAQKKSGEFPRQWFQGRYFYKERNDILAQNVRLGILSRAFHLTPPAFDKKLEKSLNRLLNKQVSNHETKANGGFLFGWGEKKKKTKHVNVWVSAFAIQALSYYLQWKRGGKKFSFNPFLFV